MERGLSGGDHLCSIPDDAWSSGTLGPEALGVSDLQTPDFGDPISIAGDQTPVFWACGVTPQAAAKQAKPALMITHSPGHMFVTDRLDAEYEI